MKKQLFTEEERKRRLSLIRWQFIMVPIGIIMIIMAVRSSRWDRVAYATTACISLLAVCLWLHQWYIYTTRLKGTKRELFMTLYEQLFDYSAAVDIIGTVVTLEAMAKVSESNFGDVREFAFQKAGLFLESDSFIRGLPLRLFSVTMCTVAHFILHAGLEDLPQFLSSEQEWERDIAAHRLAELRGR